MKVVFICSWGNNSTELLNKYKTFTPGNSGVWKNITGVTDVDKADCVVFLEEMDYRINVDNKIVICFPREPVNTKNWEGKSLKYGFTYDTLHHVVTNPQFMDKTYDELESLEYNKSKKVSCVVSKKMGMTGHKQRVNFIIKLTSIYPDLCDIYGSGWGNELNRSYKGSFGCYHRKSSSIKTKYDGLVDYKYSLCFENTKRKNYFTEKFTDCILCWTVPIYWGCSNIGDFFPKDSYYEIDINSPDCIERIKEIVNTPIQDKNIIALKEARDLVLNKYNLWDVVSEITSS